MRARGNIVIYEEDRLTRALLEEWLTQAGYRVRIGNRREPGADKPCDLVIMSVSLPRDCGVECTQDVRTAHAETPIVAISGHFRTGLAAAGSAAEMLRVAQVFAKPLCREKLLGSVRAILRD
jgi:DNA-binding response OmpR family regulator